MNRWRTLVFAVVFVAVALVAVGRLPRPDAQNEAADESARPEVAITFRLLDAKTAEPARAAVAKESRVRLTLSNASAQPLAPRLAGYEDRVSIPEIAPGASWTGSFVADRPGADFALWIDGEPVARLAVAGSHLVEGHR